MFKKLICLIISFIIILTFSTAVAMADNTNDIIYGDVNSDNDINAEDALDVLKYAAKIIDGFDEDSRGMIAADVSGDQDINAEDALLILKYTAKIIDSFPCEENVLATAVPITDTPVPTSTPEPTEKPVAGPDMVVELSVKSLNDVAVLTEDELTFLSPHGHDDGAEMINPFSDYQITDGVSISFWYTPAEEISDIYGNTGLLTFTNEEKAQIIKFDMEGTYQYGDGESSLNCWEAGYKFEKDTKYFMTCVISNEGLKYYVNGKPMPISQKGELSGSSARANLLPLITDADTQLFIGGTDNLWWNEMVELSRHDLPENTKVESVKAYMKPMNNQEIENLYNFNKEMDESKFSGKVWIMGDSIAAHHEKTASVRPLYGWGEIIPEYYTDFVIFDNNAVSSQSTSSYYSLQKNTYNFVFTNMKENDYAIISFGHNDHNAALLNGFDRVTDPDAGSDVEYSYKWWLKNYYIDPVLEKGAVPILMSSVVRWSYTNGVFSETERHLKYGKAMKELVDEYAQKGITVYYIDAQSYTYELYSKTTASDAQLYHGMYGPEGGGFFDNTHYSEIGARMISDFITSQLKQMPLKINEYLK